MRYAIYRAYYSDPRIFAASLRSIDPFVDRIFLFWTDKPWGNFDFVEYDGGTYTPPRSLGEMTKAVAKAHRGKNIVKCIYAHTKTPFNQLTGFVNKILEGYKQPETVIIMEPDHVWGHAAMTAALMEFADARKFAPAASSAQVEVWRPPHVQGHYQCPNRPQRTGVVFWDTDTVRRLPETRTQGEPANGPMARLRASVHNFGFAVDKDTMFWKHICAIGFSGTIGDSLPNVEWLKRKWLGWEEGVGDLEISRGHESDIAKVFPLDLMSLPKEVR